MRLGRIHGWGDPLQVMSVYEAIKLARGDFIRQSHDDQNR